MCQGTVGGIPKNHNRVNPSESQQVRRLCSPDNQRVCPWDALPASTGFPNGSTILSRPRVGYTGQPSIRQAISQNRYSHRLEVSKTAWSSWRGAPRTSPAASSKSPRSHPTSCWYSGDA